MKIITFFNNKGGVGKTTLAVNIASYFASKFEKKILFLDADPQANSTQMIIPEERWQEFYGEDAINSTLIDYLHPIQEGDSNLDLNNDPFYHSENRFFVDLIPGHPQLSIIEDILSDAWNKCSAGDLGGFRKSNWLRVLKEHYNKNYDYLIVDVGPSLGALNRSLLLNTDFIITPMGSDIFSLIGISNISTWISNWMKTYTNAIDLLKSKYDKNTISKYSLNFQIDNTTRLIGYSIQQYVTRSFADGRRPVASYDRIISKIPESINENLEYLIYRGLTIENLNLGDVPYLYSLVPLAQSSNAPMYNLSYSDGVVGGQAASVKKYAGMLNSIAKKILNNIGDDYEH